MADRTTHRDGSPYVPARGLFAQVPHTLVDIPDRRILEEGTLIGHQGGAPVYTWWNPETEAHGVYVLERYGPPHVGRRRRS